LDLFSFVFSSSIDLFSPTLINDKNGNTSAIYEKSTVNNPVQIGGVSKAKIFKLKQRNILSSKRVNILLGNIIIYRRTLEVSMCIFENMITKITKF
jgi:hypothetical protein